MCIFTVFAFDFNQLSCLCGNFKVLHILGCLLQTKIILLLCFFSLKFRYFPPPHISFINLFWLAHSMLGWMTVVNSYHHFLLFLQERFQCFEVDSDLGCEASCPPALRIGQIQFRLYLRWRWSWTPESSVFRLCVLEFQECSTTPNLRVLLVDFIGPKYFPFLPTLRSSFENILNGGCIL